MVNERQTDSLEQIEYGFCARRDGPNTVDSTILPIVFVPGVMGSRLYFPDIDEYWDPDRRVRRMLHWLRISADRERRELHAENSPANVMTEDPDEDLEESEEGHGWEGVAWEFYGEFLRWLNDDDRGFPANCQVYAVGYDWRQDNRNSGEHLAQEVDRILEEQDAEQIILISHSMGGLVTRSAMKSVDGFADKVRAAIHVVQPTTGAPVLYRRFFTGAISGIDGSSGLSRILGNTSRKFTTIISGLSGPLQLLPTNDYVDVGGEPWLRYGNDEGEEHAWTGDVFDSYSDPRHCPPGLLRHGDYVGDAAQIRRDLIERVGWAKDFHEELGLHKHDDTYSILSDGLETDMAFLHDSRNDDQPVVLQRRRQGDSTVPRTSGDALFSGERAIEGEDDARQYVVQNVAHDTAFNEDVVRDLVARIVNRILGVSGIAVGRLEVLGPQEVLLERRGETKVHRVNDVDAGRTRIECNRGRIRIAASARIWWDDDVERSETLSAGETLQHNFRERSGWLDQDNTITVEALEDNTAYEIEMVSFDR